MKGLKESRCRATSTGLRETCSHSKPQVYTFHPLTLTRGVIKSVSEARNGAYFIFSACNTKRNRLTDLYLFSASYSSYLSIVSDVNGRCLVCRSGQVRVAHCQNELSFWHHYSINTLLCLATSLPLFHHHKNDLNYPTIKTIQTGTKVIFQH